MHHSHTPPPNKTVSSWSRYVATQPSSHTQVKWWSERLSQTLREALSQKSVKRDEPGGTCHTAEWVCDVSWLCWNRKNEWGVWTVLLNTPMMTAVIVPWNVIWSYKVNLTYSRETSASLEIRNLGCGKASRWSLLMWLMSATVTRWSMISPVSTDVHTGYTSAAVHSPLNTCTSYLLFRTVSRPWAITTSQLMGDTDYRKLK